MADLNSKRVCFLLQLKADRIQDYLAAHEHVWPEMLDALRASGWHNYSLFVRPADGLVIGYLETDDFEAARSRMAETDVNAKWQSEMADFFVDDDTRPDEAMKPLTEYFHLA